MTGTDPMPEICKHDDPSWCTPDCAEKARVFDEWVRANVRRLPPAELVFEGMERDSPDELYFGKKDSQR